MQITETDVRAVVKSLKTGKARGEDDIRPEMLKAMNVYRVHWLTRVFQVACRTGQAPMQWQTKCGNFSEKMSQWWEQLSHQCPG